MKTLLQYIQESKSSSKTFTFKFDGVDNVSEIIKTLSEDENLTVEDNNVSVVVSLDTIKNITATLDSLNSIIKNERKGTHSSNNEHYSNIISALEKTMTNVTDYITELQQPEESEEDPKDDSNEDEK